MRHVLFLTLLEARIPAERWYELQENYLKLRNKGLPAQMVEVELTQSDDDPEEWKLSSLWHSRDALLEFRATVQTPEGLLLFRSVGVEPTVRMFEVVDKEVH